MSLVIDADMIQFAKRMHITSSRMVEDYGSSTIDEIIEQEAARGNDTVIDVAREYNSSPFQLVRLFKLTNVDNRYSIIKRLSDSSRVKLLKLLDDKDMVMGLHFFTQEKLLDMLGKVDTKELVNVALNAFALEEIVAQFEEEDMQKFFMNKNVEKEFVTEQLKALPPEVMRKFVEGVTGRPAEETNPNDLINQIDKLPDDKYREFMASVDPDVQRQLIYQMAKIEPDTLTYFDNEAYTNMLEKVQKPDMVAAMSALRTDSLSDMMIELPYDLLSIVEAQVDEFKFAAFLQAGRMDVLQSAMMM